MKKFITIMVALAAVCVGSTALADVEYHPDISESLNPPP